MVNTVVKDTSIISPYPYVAQGSDAASVGTWLLVPVLLLIGIVALIAVTWLLASVMRRVLGVPVGWLRSIVVAAVVSLATGGLVYLAVDQFFTGDAGRDISPGPAVIIGAIALMWMLGFGAAGLTVLELIAPTGSVTVGTRPVPPLSALREARARNQRYRQVTTIFLRHGLTSGRPTRATGGMQRIARSFREALEESGTTFVKLGQNLAARETVLPPEFTRELTSLQTAVTPAPWDLVRPVMVEALGADPDDIFENVEHEPMAAASVAQVHRGRLSDGTAVVLKVQRPGVVEEVTRDAEIVQRVCARLERTSQWARSMGLSRLASSFTTSLAEELDYRIEAANMREMAGPVTDTGLVMPRVHEEFCSRRLLVMDELTGTPLACANEELTAMSTDQRRELADLLMGATLRQMMDHGVFQADPHPGNVLLMRDVTIESASSRSTSHPVGSVTVDVGMQRSGEVVRDIGLGMLDFGAVGHLDAEDRSRLASVFAAIDHGDSRILTAALLDLMDRPEDLDLRSLERSVGTLLTRYGGGIDRGEGSTLFSRLMEMFNTYRLVVPEPIAVALRSLAELEGTLRVMDAEYPLVPAARREGTALVKERLRPGSLKDAAEGIALESLPLLRTLPRQMAGLVNDLQDGRMSVSMRLFRHPGDRDFVTGLLQQITVALVAGFCVLGGVMLIAFGTGGPVLVDDLTWHAAMGYVVLFCGFLMSLRTVTMVLFRSNRPEQPSAR